MKEVEGDRQFSTGPDDTDSLESEDFTIPSFITLARIYDLLAIIALKLDPELAEEVLEMHEQGLLKGAMPSLVINE